jgi:hypothetical protein
LVILGDVIDQDQSGARVPEYFRVQVAAGVMSGPRGATRGRARLFREGKTTARAKLFLAGLPH